MTHELLVDVSNDFLYDIVIIQLSLDHSDDNWATPDMPALADVMSKLLRKRIKDDQVESSHLVIMLQLTIISLSSSTSPSQLACV